MAGYRINLYRSIVFLHTNTEKQVMDILPFTTASEGKNLGINLAKEVKDLNHENIKPLKKNRGH